jgi:hypothetical protein
MESQFLCSASPVLRLSGQFYLVATTKSERPLHLLGNLLIYEIQF